ncbi:MAG: hypothetical protein IPG71_13640 [bacterium]|nr:hypothetical protein [bacterium]
MKPILLTLLLPALIWAQSSSENFTLTKSVIDAGGGASSSASFNLVSAFGQPTPIGAQTSPNFTLYAGFLSPALGVSPLSPIQELVIAPNGNDARLWWEVRAGAGSYAIHRSTLYEFAPTPGNLIATVTDTTYTDVGVLATPTTQQYYIVVINTP